MLPRERASCPNCRASVVFATGAKRVTCRACDCVLGRREKKVKRNPSTSEQVKSAAADFKEFHQTEPRLHKVTLPAPPKVALLLGELTEFTYQPPAESARGTDEDDHKPVSWHHSVGDTGYLGPLRIGRKPKLYVSADRRQMWVSGGDQWFDPSAGVRG